MSTEYPSNYRNMIARQQANWRVVADEPDPNVAWVRQRWHNTLANPSLDCAPKSAARRDNVENPTVRCICGCRQEFSAVVR